MVLSLVLVAALAVALVALGVVSLQLRRARRELRTANSEARDRRRRPPRRALRVAEKAVRTVVDTAEQVRARGVSEFLMSSIQDYSRWSAADRAQVTTTARPDGTVTIFFSDIQDSTVINERLGDASWLRLLTEHDRLVRAKVAQHHGTVVKTYGDGFMVAFGEPTDGIRAALAIQAELARGGGQRLRRTPVAVRIGMHVGQVTSRDGDYFGRNVAMAARVAAQADGGQILVSDDVRQALEEGGGTDEALLVAGEAVELKGLAGRHQLWIVEPVR